MSLERHKDLLEAVDALKKICPDIPKIAVVLGSGLARLLEEIDVEVAIEFRQIPHFKQPSVEGHIGRMVVCRYEGIRFICLQGRLHFYEGHSLEEVVFPFRVLGLCGVDSFILTNAAGGIHEDLKPLDLVLIKDHINLTGQNPLRGPNDDSLGPRFPDLSFLYDVKLRDLVKRAALKVKVPLKEGVYVATHGPSFETPAEIRMYRLIGGDVVGMSTAPEAIAIHHMGKRVVGISFVSNLAAGVSDQALNHEEVLENARQGFGSFSKVILEAVHEIGKSYA